MVDEDVVCADRRENVGGRRRLDLGEAGRRGGHERVVFQGAQVEVVQLVEAAQIQRFGQDEDVLGADFQARDEERLDHRGDAFGDLQADGGAEAAAQQLGFHRGEEVFGVVLFDFQVLVAGEAERVVFEHLHAGEQVVEVGADDVFHRHERGLAEDVEGVLGADLAGHLFDADEARQRLGDLDPREVLFAGQRVAEDDREVEGQAGNVGERV